MKHESRLMAVGAPRLNARFPNNVSAPGTIVIARRLTAIDSTSSGRSCYGRKRNNSTELPFPVGALNGRNAQIAVVASDMLTACRLRADNGGKPETCADRGG